MGKAIMIQGTASGVGKSTFVAGLCRLLRQEGYSVAPFKAQNMSSNAHFLADGSQMARSQAIAAYACGLEPETDMNPVLLKPATVTGSEVILNGHSIGNLMDYEYPSLKRQLAEEIQAAYQRLSSRYEIVVVEGAGSPVELNLKENDVVNMGFAVRNHCPVLLVGDISRGGIFASVYGTLQLLEPQEQALVQGILINKFCGDARYFQDGVDILEKITGKPVVGVLPQMEINLEDEDCITDSGIPKTEAQLRQKMEDGISYRAYMEQQFVILAERIRQNIKLDSIFNAIGVSK